MIGVSMRVTPFAFLLASLISYALSGSLSLSERRLFWLTYSQADQGAAATPNSTFAGTSPGADADPT